MKRSAAQGGFLYDELLSELRSRIARGRYPPASRLPSLTELTKEFGVSSITVRRALRELVYEGLVRGHQGLGVFVKSKPRIHRVLAGDPDQPIGAEITRAGFAPSLIEIDRSVIKPDDEIAERLKLRRGSQIFRHRKCTLADGEPVALHILHMRPSLARVIGADLGKLFIFPLLKKRKIPIANLKCEFSSTTLGVDDAQLLQLQAGHPALRVDYTAFGDDGRPLLLGSTICRPDRFVFEVSLPRRKSD